MDNRTPSSLGFGYSRVTEHQIELMSCRAQSLGDPIDIRWYLERTEGHLHRKDYLFGRLSLGSCGPGCPENSALVTHFYKAQVCHVLRHPKKGKA